MDERLENDDSEIIRATRIQTAALMVGLITAGSLIAIPLPGTPVPIVLQNLFVVLTGLFLPPLWALITIAVYLTLGAIGLPIFAGATGGLSHFIGPTGGYLFGFLIAAPVTSLIFRVSQREMKRPGRIALLSSGFVGFLFPYVPGILWLQHVTSLDLYPAFLIGALPFLPGDLLKLIVCTVILSSLPESLWRRFR